MGVTNSLTEIRKPFWLKWFGSVIPVVLPIVLVMSAWSAIVCVLGITLNLNIQVGSTSSPTITSTVGFAIALLLVFRTNTGYERWYEGRRLFDTIATATRMIQMYIFAYFPANTEQERQERITAAKLCVAFFRATKHHLRGQDPRVQQDMKGLIPNVNANFQDPPQQMTQTAAMLAKESEEHLAHGSHGHHDDSHDHAQTFAAPVQTTNGQTINLVGTIPREPKAAMNVSNQDLEAQASNMKSHRVAMKLSKIMPETWSDPSTAFFPMYIVHMLFRYLALYKETHRVHFITVYGMNIYIGSLVSSFASLTRILLTPVPIAYAIHIRQCLLLYCIFLPFTLVRVTYWITIVIQAFTVYVLFGIEAIALEVENPFGLDPNDLPLDDLDLALSDEIDYFTSVSVPWSSDWTFGPGIGPNNIMNLGKAPEMTVTPPFATGPLDVNGAPLPQL